MVDLFATPDLNDCVDIEHVCVAQELEALICVAVVVTAEDY